jgi:hypothetical protein
MHRFDMIVIQLLAIYGLMLLIRDADGPWGLIGKWRNLMMKLPLGLGVQFYNLVNCPICLGAQAAICVYGLHLLAPQYPKLTGGLLALLTGAAVGLIFDTVLDRLRRE